MSGIGLLAAELTAHIAVAAMSAGLTAKGALQRLRVAGRRDR